MVPAPDRRAPHEAREMAESFGSDPAQYDRTRPRYPRALIDRLLAGGPRDVLDVGIGTGISARPLREAGCRVLGIDVDDRMADFARRDGFEVVTASFETWEPDGRSFDLVVSGQAWHWVDPVAGAAKAAAVLRPGGRLAVFWNVFVPPPDVGRAFADVHRRVLPDSPRNVWDSEPAAAYGALTGRVVDGIRQAATLGDPEEWHVDWHRSYTREEWLDQLVTSGEAGRLTPERRAELVAQTGRAIDVLGGAFEMGYTALAVVATRWPDAPAR